MTYVHYSTTFHSKAFGKDALETDQEETTFLASDTESEEDRDKEETTPEEKGPVLILGDEGFELPEAENLAKDIIAIDKTEQLNASDNTSTTERLAEKQVADLHETVEIDQPQTQVACFSNDFFTVPTFFKVVTASLLYK